MPNSDTLLLPIRVSGWIVDVYSETDSDPTVGTCLVPRIRGTVNVTLAAVKSCLCFSFRLTDNEIL